MASELATDPSLRGYALLLRRRKWWVAGLALAGLGISLALSFTEAKQYTATAHRAPGHWSCQSAHHGQRRDGRNDGNDPVVRA